MYTEAEKRKDRRLDVDRYEFLIYCLLGKALQAGNVYAQDSNESRSFEDDLIRPEPWKDSSDGQGIEPQVPTINARHGSKYFGLKKEASAYTLVADQVQVF
jgi:hypothetical protein